MGAVTGNLLPPFTDPRWTKPSGAEVSPDGRAITFSAAAATTAITRGPAIALASGQTYTAAAEVSVSAGGTARFVFRDVPSGRWLDTVEITGTAQISRNVTLPDVQSTYNVELWVTGGTVTFANVTITPAETEESAALEGPYEDGLHMQIPFARISFYLKPWRAYMDTWPGQRFLQTLGIVFNPPPQGANAVAELLAERGFQSGRIETFPGQFQYDDPSQLLPEAAAQLQTMLTAMQRHGIRPLLLLNANSGWPVPIRQTTVNLLSDAHQGARSIVIDRPSSVRPGYTGFRGMAYQIGYPLITSCSPETGECQLSAPLPRAVSAGELTLYTLKYQPFAGALFADGTENPAAYETVAGWMTFVQAITSFAKGVLGTEGAPDAGFDLEVWNEYTFGSQFLNDAYYYNPPRQYSQPIEYRNHGLRATGPELILPMTVDYVNDPQNGLPNVRVISGFANQRPWESGATMWPGQTGFSRHYYTGVRFTPVQPNHPLIDALGQEDGASPFVPAVTVSMPEWWFYGYQTEHVTRDISPVFSPEGSVINGVIHGRFAHRIGGAPAQVWMTETNFFRKEWGQRLAGGLGISYNDPALQALLHRVAAKALLRLLTFHSHKGIHTANVYAARDPSEGLEVLPQAFYDALAANNHQLNDAVRATMGPQAAMLKRMADLFRSGAGVEVARPLTVSAVVEYEPRLVFAGDGTAAHPDRWHRDDFAVLPYQLDDRRYAVAYYVVTQSIVQVWNEEAGQLDPARYQMPDQDFAVTLQNVRGDGAAVSVYDPLRDVTLAAEVMEAAATAMTVRLPAADYPRMLLITEAEAGPLIQSPTVTPEAGGATVSFSTNVPAAARVTWGAPPERAAGGQVDLPPGQSHQAQIALADGEGIRITVEAGGLQAVWPRWGWDPAGAPARPGSNLLPLLNDPRWTMPAGATVSANARSVTLDNRANPNEHVIFRSPQVTLIPGHTYRAETSMAWSAGAVPLFAVLRTGEWVYSTDRRLIDHPVATFTVPADNASPYWVELWLTDAAAGTATFADVVLRDVTALTGTVQINGGAAYTASTGVTLALSAAGAAEMRFSADGVIWTAWEPYAATKSFTLPGGDGTKTVHAQFRDGAGTVSVPAQDSIHLDTTPPAGTALPLPPTHTTDTFAVAWEAGDGGGSGVAGVRLYYSLDGGSSWTPYPGEHTVSPISFAGSGDGTYSFSIQALDRAGNAEAAPAGAGSVEATTVVQSGGGSTSLLPPLDDPGWVMPVMVSAAGDSVTLRAQYGGEARFVSPQLTLEPGGRYQVTFEATVATGARGRVLLSHSADQWSTLAELAATGQMSLAVTVPPGVTDGGHRLQFIVTGGEVTFTQISLTRL